MIQKIEFIDYARWGHGSSSGVFVVYVDSGNWEEAITRPEDPLRDVWASD